MEKIKKYIGVITLFIVILSAGIIIGSKLENSKQEKINGSLHTTQKIAVVNLDEGTNYQGEHKNYAKELMNNYSEIYVLTGLADAQTGIEDGRYAAYVIIPSNFSQNFISINKDPQKSLLKYEISGNLSQNATDSAWKNVMQLKESINDDVGYVYVSSILGEFHNGQDNAVKVLSNDNKDKEVLMAISNLDLVATLDLKEVERLQNNIEDLDINPNIEKNKLIIKSIDTAYKNYLSTTSQQLTDVQDSSTKLNEDNSKVKISAEAIKNLINSDGSKNYNVDKTKDSLNQYNLNLVSQLNNITNKLTSTSNDHISSKNIYVTDRKRDIDSLTDKMQTSHDTLTTNQWSDFTTSVNLIFKDSLNTFDIDWINYPSIHTLLESKKSEELVNNAVNYIDKFLLSQFSTIDYSKPNLDFDKIIQEILNNVSNDQKLESCLKTYANSIGKTEEESELYTLKDYVDENKDIFNTLPDTTLTPNSDQLQTDIKVAMKEDIKEVTEVNNSELHANINKLINNQSSLDIKTGVQTSIDDYKKLLDNVPIFKIDGINDLVKNTSSINVSDIQTLIDQDLAPLSDDQKRNKLALLTTINNHNILNSNFHQSLLTYDPLKNIDSNEINDFVNDYDSNNTVTKYKIENKNREYVTFVSDSYNNANDQVSSMKDDVLKYQKLSDEMIVNGLENAKKVRSDTSRSNSKLMENLINKLPYTRNGTVENNHVYDFIMASSDVEGNKNANTIAESSFDYTLLFVSFSSACIIIFGGISVYIKIKSKSVNN